MYTIELFILQILEFINTSLCFCENKYLSRQVKICNLHIWMLFVHLFLGLFRIDKLPNEKIYKSDILQNFSNWGVNANYLSSQAISCCSIFSVQKCWIPPLLLIVLIVQAQCHSIAEAHSKGKESFIPDFMEILHVTCNFLTIFYMLVCTSKRTKNQLKKF